MEHKGTRDLKSNRLTLRKFEISDAPSMFKNYASDIRVTKFLSWKAYEKVEDIENYLRVVTPNNNNETVYNWAITLNNEVIGSISVISLDNKNHSCEIGYCVGYNYWNKGFTTEALNIVLDYLFNIVGMNRIFAKHDIDNMASGEVMKKCNMKYEGRLREHYLRHDGTYSDSLVYGIIKSEYNK